MGEKIKKAGAFKDMLRTPKYKDGVEGIKEMQKDNEILKELAKEATLEWLEEKKVTRMADENVKIEVQPYDVSELVHRST